jgi:hypothetical protein
MVPEKRFIKLGKEFWANVRTISQQNRYTVRGSGQIKVHSVPDMVRAMQVVGLGTHHLCGADGVPTKLGNDLHEYFKYRADVLNTFPSQFGRLKSTTTQRPSAAGLLMVFTKASLTV